MEEEYGGTIPPKCIGKKNFEVIIKIDQCDILEQYLKNGDIFVRFTWWGDKEKERSSTFYPSISMRGDSSIRLVDKYRYDVVVSERKLRDYLMDMELILFEVYSSNELIGHVCVDEMELLTCQKELKRFYEIQSVTQPDVSIGKLWIDIQLLVDKNESYLREEKKQKKPQNNIINEIFNPKSFENDQKNFSIDPISFDENDIDSLHHLRYIEQKLNENANPVDETIIRDEHDLQRFRTVNELLIKSSSSSESSSPPLERSNDKEEDTLILEEELNIMKSPKINQIHDYVLEDQNMSNSNQQVDELEGLKFIQPETLRILKNLDSLNDSLKSKQQNSTNSFSPQDQTPNQSMTNLFPSHQQECEKKIFIEEKEVKSEVGPMNNDQHRLESEQKNRSEREENVSSILKKSESDRNDTKKQECSEIFNDQTTSHWSEEETLVRTLNQSPIWTKRNRSFDELIKGNQKSPIRKPLMDKEKMNFIQSTFNSLKLFIKSIKFSNEHFLRLHYSSYANPIKYVFIRFFRPNNSKELNQLSYKLRSQERKHNMFNFHLKQLVQLKLTSILINSYYYNDNDLQHWPIRIYSYNSQHQQEMRGTKSSKLLAIAYIDMKELISNDNFLIEEKFIPVYCAKNIGNYHENDEVGQMKFSLSLSSTTLSCGQLKRLKTGFINKSRKKLKKVRSSSFEQISSADLSSKNRKSDGKSEKVVTFDDESSNVNQEEFISNKLESFIPSTTENIGSTTVVSSQMKKSDNDTLFGDVRQRSNPNDVLEKILNDSGNQRSNTQRINYQNVEKGNNGNKFYHFYKLPLLFWFQLNAIQFSDMKNSTIESNNHHNKNFVIEQLKLRNSLKFRFCIRSDLFSKKEVIDVDGINQMNIFDISTDLMTDVIEFPQLIDRLHESSIFIEIYLRLDENNENFHFLGMIRINLMKFSSILNDIQTIISLSDGTTRTIMNESEEKVNISFGNLQIHSNEEWIETRNILNTKDCCQLKFQLMLGKSDYIQLLKSYNLLSSHSLSTSSTMMITSEHQNSLLSKTILHNFYLSLQEISWKLKISSTSSSSNVKSKHSQCHQSNELLRKSSSKSLSMQEECLYITYEYVKEENGQLTIGWNTTLPFIIKPSFNSSTMEMFNKFEKFYLNDNFLFELWTNRQNSSTNKSYENALKIAEDLDSLFHRLFLQRRNDKCFYWHLKRTNDHSLIGIGRLPINRLIKRAYTFYSHLLHHTSESLQELIEPELIQIRFDVNPLNSSSSPLSLVQSFNVNLYVNYTSDMYPMSIRSDELLKVKSSPCSVEDVLNITISQWTSNNLELGKFRLYDYLQNKLPEKLMNYSQLNLHQMSLFGEIELIVPDDTSEKMKEIIFLKEWTQMNMNNSYLFDEYFEEYLNKNHSFKAAIPLFLHKYLLVNGLIVQIRFLMKVRCIGMVNDEVVPISIFNQFISKKNLYRLLNDENGLNFFPLNSMNSSKSNLYETKSSLGESIQLHLSFQQRHNFYIPLTLDGLCMKYDSFSSSRFFRTFLNFHHFQLPSTFNESTKNCSNLLINFPHQQQTNISNQQKQQQQYIHLSIQIKQLSFSLTFDIPYDELENCCYSCSALTCSHGKPVSGETIRNLKNLIESEYLINFVIHQSISSSHVDRKSEYFDLEVHRIFFKTIIGCRCCYPNSIICQNVARVTFQVQLSEKSLINKKMDQMTFFYEKISLGVLEDLNNQQHQLFAIELSHVKSSNVEGKKFEEKTKFLRNDKFFNNFSFCEYFDDFDDFLQSFFIQLTSAQRLMMHSIHQHQYSNNMNFNSNNHNNENRKLKKFFLPFNHTTHISSNFPHHSHQLEINDNLILFLSSSGLLKNYNLSSIHLNELIFDKIGKIIDVTLDDGIHEIPSVNCQSNDNGCQQTIPIEISNQFDVDENDNHSPSMKRIKTSKSSHKNWNTIGEGKEENNQKLSDELDENQYFACDIMVEEIRNKMNSKNFNSILFKDHVGEYHQIDVSKKECLVKNVIIKFHKDHILDQLIERENENDQKLKFHIRLDSIDLTNDHDIESIYNLNDKFSSYVLIDLHLLRRYGQTLNGWYNIENSSGDVIGLLKVLIQPTSSFSKLEKIRESTKTYIPLNNPTNTFTNISRQQLFNSSTSIPQSTVSIPPISPDKSNPYMMKLNETLSNLERLKFRFNDIMSSTAANMSTTTTTKTMAVSSNTNTSLHITPSIDNNQMNNSEVTILPQTEKEENKCSKGIQTINSPSKSHETTETFSANRQLYEFHDETAIRSSFDTNMPSTMLNDNNSEVLNELMENGVNNDIPFNPSLDKRTTNSPAESISITDDVDDDESVNTVTITENPIDDDNEIDEDDNIEINENEIMSTLQRMEDKLRRDKFKSSPTKQSKEKIHLLQMFNDISGKFVKEKKSLDENKIQHNVKLERFKSHFTPDELKRIDAIFQKQNKKT